MVVLQSILVLGVVSCDNFLSGKNNKWQESNGVEFDYLSPLKKASHWTVKQKTASEQKIIITKISE